MNELKYKILRNSKRYIKLQTFNKLPNFKNQHKFTHKYIIMHLPRKAKLSKWTYTLISFSAIGGLFFYFRNHIKEQIKSISQDFKNSSKKYLNYLLLSTEIKEGGVILLDKIFKENHSQRATIELLNSLFVNEEVKEATTKYGVSLFKDLISEGELQTECKKLFVDILKTDEIKREGVDALKYIIEKEESKDIMAQYFKVIFLRSDIIKALSSLITDAGVYTMDQPTTKKKFADFLTDVWSDPNLRWIVIKKTFNFWQTAAETENKENLPQTIRISEEIHSIEAINNNDGSYQNKY
jgi:hypothetical protein